MADNKKNVNTEEVVEKDDFEEVKDVEFKDVPGTTDVAETKKTDKVEVVMSNKEKAKWFGLGAIAGAAVAGVSIFVYAKFGIGDPHETVQKVVEVAPEVVGA